MRTLPLAAFLFFFLSSLAAANQLQAKTALERLGARVRVDRDGNVTEVDFVRRSVSNYDLRHLRDLPHLRRLNLERTWVSDSGLAHLRDLSRLEDLNLARTRIGDSSLDRVRNLRRLRTLDLTGTNVTLAAVERLRQARPGLRIRC
jgi:hypothetical protein